LWIGKQHTDYNGIVLFVPDALRRFYGGRIRKGTNLFKRLMTSDDGDEVIRRGIVVPVLAITDAGYSIVVRRHDEKSTHDADVVVASAGFRLKVRDEVVLADLVVLREWIEDVDWQHIPVAGGRYSVEIRGFRRLAKTKRKILDAGYEFVLTPVERWPRTKADTGKKMQTLKFDDDE
jgi:hypothetical protein